MKKEATPVGLQRIAVHELGKLKESVSIRLDFINTITDRINILNSAVKTGKIKNKKTFVFLPINKTEYINDFRKSEMALEICRLLVEMKAKKDELKVYENRLKEYEQRYEEIIIEMNDNFDSMYEMAKSKKEEILQFKENLDKHVPKETDDIRLKVEFYLYIKHNLTEHFTAKGKTLRIV